MSLCECGCGQDAGVYAQNHLDKGQIKDQPKRFINHHNGKVSERSHSAYCENGHLRSPENSYPSWEKEGKLRCRKCTEERVKDKVEEGTHYSVREETAEARKHTQKYVDLKCRYGLTREKYDAILRQQRGLCAICSVELDSSQPNLIPAVDHVHFEGEPRYSDKQVRGLL